ncbi:MAG: hypothetical protein ACE5I1_24325 [bacterium]
MNTWFLVADISVYSHLGPAFSGLYFFHRLHGYQRLLVIFFAMSAIFDIITSFMADSGIHNLWLVNIFFLMEYCLLTLIFSFWQSRNKIKFLLRASILFFFLIWSIKNIYYGEIFTFDSLSYSVSSFMLALIAIYTLISMQKDESHHNLSDPNFGFRLLR